jgi:hypothetical protein
MDIKDVKIAQGELEKKIAALIEEFETTTGTKVHNIWNEVAENIGSTVRKHNILTDVKI